MTAPMRNGIRVDPEKWRATQRRSVENQIAKRRARVVVRQEGNKTTVRRSPLKPRSAKRAAQMREYGKQREQRLGYDPPCSAADLPIPGVQCRGWADTIQHLAGRRGKRLNDESLFLDLCWPHHSWAELHPTEAKRLGLARSKVGAA